MNSLSLLTQFPKVRPLVRKEWGAHTNEAIEEFNSRWMNHLSFVERRFRVGIFGEFDAGKSTLINSLLGGSALSVSNLPETDDVQIVAYPGATYRPYPKGARFFPQPGESAFRFGLELWDTPGTNADLKRHEQIAKEAISQVDHLLVLVRAQDGVTRTVKELLEIVGRTKGPKADVTIVLTHFDAVVRSSLDQSEAEEVVSDFRQFLGLDRNPWRINATSLGDFDGPELVEWLRKTIVDFAGTQLVRELTSSSFWRQTPTKSHWLRAAAAQGMNWQELVPDELHTKELRNLGDDWIERHRAARREFRRSKALFPIRYLQHSLAGARAAWAKEWRSANEWFSNYPTVRSKFWLKTADRDQRQVGPRRP